MSTPGTVVERSPMRAFAAGALLVLLVATTAFVAHRNREHQQRELARASAAARAVAEGREPLAAVIASGVVAAPRRSEKYPFLRVRHILSPDPRPLGGPDATPEDKLLADAATEAERDGGFTRILRDGSGRIVAAVAVKPIAGAGGTAVVVARPLESPAPYPFLVIGGLLALGAFLCSAGRRLGGHAATIGLGAGLALLAIPAAAWGGALASTLIVAIAAGTAYADSRGRVTHWASIGRRHRVAYAYLLPAGLGMGVLVLTPFIFGCVLGFFDHSQGEWHYVGLKNFAAILSGDGKSFNDPLNFWFTLSVTLAWTSVNVALHVTIGVVLALALRERWLRCRGLFRVLLILPWAVPNYITALIWRGMFQQQFGAVNGVLDFVGIDRVAWFSHFSTAFTANVVTNTWLGFPFMMVVALGALESIPRDLYEAAAVDGATAWQRFAHITLPNLRPALLPAVVLGSIWTFNMFNVIYLVSGGKPAGSTDILVTQAYRWAFERGQRYGMAAAYATIIFLILVVWTLLANRLARESKT